LPCITRKNRLEGCLSYQIIVFLHRNINVLIVNDTVKE
jgi:hypothetical protein